MQVPGSVSRLLKRYPRWARMMPDSIPDTHPWPRATLIPLPLTCLAVCSIHQEPQGIYYQRPSQSPRPYDLSLPLSPVLVLSFSAWLRNVAATSPSPEGEPLQYQRANALESDTTEYECGYYQTASLDS